MAQLSRRALLLGGILAAAPVTAARFLVPTAFGGGQVAGVTGIIGGVPVLSLSGPLTYAANAASGTVVATISGVPAGVTPTLSPNDGRMTIANNAGVWQVIVGSSLSSAGPIALAVAAVGATGASATVAVTAAAAYVYNNVEAQTYAARSATVPNDTFKAAYDVLFGRFKSGRINGSNLIAAFDMISIRAAHAQDIALMDLFNTSYTATLSTPAPVFDAGYGFTTDGYVNYVQEAWALANASKYGTASGAGASFGFWTRNPDAQAGTNPQWGAISGGPWLCTRNSSGGASARLNSGSVALAAAGSVTDASGFHCVIRPAGSAALNYFHNTAKIASAATAAYSSQASTTIRQGNAFATFAQDQLAFVWAGRDLTDAEAADLYDAMAEYLAAVGWKSLASVPTSGGDAVIQANAILLPAMLNQTVNPDITAGNPTTTGKGFNPTGGIQDTDGTYWVADFGKETQSFPEAAFTPRVVHLAADRTTLLGYIDLVSLGCPAVGIQGITIDTSDNTLWVAGAQAGTAGNNLFHLAKSTTSPQLIGQFAVSPTAVSPNAICYDPVQDALYISNGNTLALFDKTGVRKSAQISFAVPYVDQVSYSADLDAFWITGGPNYGAYCGVIQLVPRHGQNYGYPRMSTMYRSADAKAIEGFSRNPTTKIATVWNDFWGHGTGTSPPNGSIQVQLPL